MAPGPLGRLVAQIIVPAIATMARALPAAYSQALQNARKSGGAAAQDAAKNAPIFGRKAMSREEALQVLNLTEKGETLTADAIQQQFERYMAANDVSKGGSFYLQSKVYRAHELLTEFKNETEKDETESPKQQ